MRKSIYILLLLYFFCAIALLSNTIINDREMRFMSISIDDGLSQSTVFDLAQDSMGNIWAATADGLNKYDGYRFTIYRYDEANPKSIQSDYMRVLLSAPNEKLLIGNREGFSVFDIKNNSFINYPLKKEVHHICQYSDSIYYMISASNLYKYNITTQKIDLLISQQDLLFYTNKIYKGELIIGTNKGLYRLEKDQLVKLNININTIIQDIRETKDGLWIATEGKGLFLLDNNGNLKNYMPQKGNSNSILSAYVRRLALDSHQRLWVGTMDGLSIYNEKNDSFDRYESNPVKKGTLSQNSVRSMLLDNQGGMWLGTYYGGLNYFNPLQNQFGLIRHIPYANSLSDNIVSTIVEGDANTLWIGTNEKGLNKYNTNTGAYSYYNINNGLLSNTIKALLVDKNLVYVGSHGGGMARINTQTGAIKNYTRNTSNIESNNIYSFVKDDKGFIWIATLDGLRIFDTQNEKFYSLRDFNPIGSQALDFSEKVANAQIYTVYKDSRNRIWMGTELGIYTFSLHNKLLVHYDVETSKRREYIYCFLEDHDQQIWIGMHSGLGKLNESNQTFKIYNTADGLPNNNVYGILQDSYRRLWISTNKGLASTSTDLKKIRLYTIKDGLQSDQFNNYSYCKLSSGEMYFGGLNGITHFYPERLIDNPYTPTAVISELKILNTIILPNDESGILTKDISHTPKIILEPTQNSFSILPTVTNFLSTKHNTFAYKLDGEDLDWTYIDDSHPISYSSLQAGEYTFHLKAGNSDGRWNEISTTLKIEVKPFWWDTIWFRLLIFALSALIIFFLARFYNNKQKLKNELALERLEQEKKEEINQTKLRFFINISHEFRTPLTLIISPLNELLNKTSDRWTRKYLQLVIRNANKLMHLVDQLMDYRRADLGVFALKVQEADPTLQIDDQMSLFSRLAKQKNIDFVYENSLDRDKIIMDINYFELTLSNLISNAFKFTPQNGSINISTYIENDDFVLKVSDTGSGMKDEVQRRVFERFYQANSEIKGTGVGLSLVKRLIELHHAQIEFESKENEGTTFIVRIPQDIKGYSQEEQITQGDEAKLYRKLTEDKVDLLIQPEDLDTTNNMDETVESEEDNTNPTILIVEDDADVRNYLISNFRETANIEKTDNGKEALEIVNNKEIDLVITDIMLPVMDGIALCKAIKQNIKTSHIPVIMLTAKSNEEDKLEGFVAGADSYVSKPFDIAILRVRVRNMLRAKHRMLEHYSESLEIEPQKVTFNELDREFLEKAKNIVEQNMDNITFSVDDFCKEMAMSRSNLHLKMKAITGESTIEFIRKIRFNHACNLLKDGRYSVSEVSIMVGFNTASYFTTSFKKYFDMLPSDYVKKQKGDY